MGWIELDGAVNVRDLGALATDDGRVTASRRLLRGDNLQDLSPSDVRTLVADIGVTTVVDLRSPGEVSLRGTRAADPGRVGPARLPLGAARAGHGHRRRRRRAGHPARRGHVPVSGRHQVRLLPRLPRGPAGPGGRGAAQHRAGARRGAGELRRGQGPDRRGGRARAHRGGRPARGRDRRLRGQRRAHGGDPGAAAFLEDLRVRRGQHSGRGASAAAADHGRVPGPA